MKTKKLVGIWLRVSHEDLLKAETPAMHLHRAKSYARDKGWDVVVVYDLGAKSGKSVYDYPETKQMLQDVKSGKITGLIFSKLARLSRSQRELIELAEIFRENEADLISLQENIDTSTSGGRFFFGMLAGLAQYYRDDAVERVSFGVPARAEMGKPLGGVAPYGYIYDENKKLILNPDEAPIRKLMYDLFLHHKRMHTVAKILNEKGYRTRSYKTKRGSKFTVTTIERLLRDPVAKGKRIRNYTKSMGDKKHWKLKPESEWKVNDVPAIISEDVHNQCMAILNGNKSKKIMQPRKTVNLFSGLLRCYCNPDKKIYVIPAMKKYVCTNPACRNKVPVDDIEVVFIEELQSFINHFDLTVFNKGEEKTVEELEALKEIIEAGMKKTKSRIDGLFELFHAGQIPTQGFNERYNPLQQELGQKEAELSTLQSDIDFAKMETMTTEETLKDNQALYNNWHTYNPEEKRNIVEAVAEEIIIHPTEVEIVLKEALTSFKSVEKGSHTHRDSY